MIESKKDPLDSLENSKVGGLPSHSLGHSGS